MNAAGVDLVKDFEGFREHAYLDIVGVTTIGYGFTRGVQLGDTMTPAEGRERLRVELAEFESGILGACSRMPSPNEAAAMTSLAFNVGLDAFKKSSVLRQHNAGNRMGAADAFRLWCRAGGKVIPGLVRRREAERALYLAES